MPLETTFYHANVISPRTSDKETANNKKLITYSN